ncbi:hypothetical protein [Neofamilia massiliensis]|uniref:hypothetical protein n=1 Tax=Neofamilia massiliensis TaxID=1673724 RepID=UPI0006BB6658|nr:hypothetical protein [Neofamilia massiliensis]
MKFIMDLSKREKILIYILTLLFILFIYLNFFKGSILNTKNTEAASYISNDDYEILLAEYDKEKSKLDKNTIYLEEVESQYKNFGKNLDLEKISQDGSIVINSFNISNVMMENKDDLKVFYIDKSLIISDTLEKIENFLNLIVSNNELFLKDINLSRIDEDIFEANIKVREYTLREVPYSGINYKHNNNSENSLENKEGSLLSALYGKEEKETTIDSINNSKTTRSTNNNREEVVNSETQIIEDEEVFEENIETKVEDNLAYKFIDENNESYNERLKLLEKRFYFNSDFINSNIENLSDISNIDKLNKENTNEILEFDFSNKLIFSDFDIKIDYDIYKISFEINGPKDLSGSIYFLDESMTLYTVDFLKFADGYENIEIFLDKTYKYPLSFQSIVTDNYNWEDLSFRNLVFYES